MHKIFRGLTMRSILMSLLLWHIIMAYIFLYPASAEKTIPMFSHEGNKIATVRTFPSKGAAQKFAEKLKSEGFEVEIREGVTQDNKTIYRVSGKKHPESLGAALSTSGVAHDEKASPDKSSELEKESLRSLVILSPRERAEFRNVNKITFSWLSVPQAVSYHVILAKDRTFTNVIHEATHVTGTSYTIEGLNYGTYFFKIRSRLSDDAEGPFSETLSFIIVPPQPATSPLYLLESGS